MDPAPSERLARQLLDALADVSAAMRDYAVSLRRTDGVIEVQRTLELDRHQNGLAVEAYVDAELSDGTAVSWLLDLTWSEKGWSVDASVAKSGQDRREAQDTVREVACFAELTVENLLHLLPSVVRDLLDRQDLKRYGQPKTRRKITAFLKNWHRRR